MKMWDGRFAGATDGLMERFNCSLPIDMALIEEDIAVNIAWARALARAGVLTEAEAAAMAAALRGILDEYAQGAIAFDDSDEDIHMAVERLLVERVGESGAKIHTGRSRNDQVATDFRMFVKKALGRIADGARELQRVLVERAEAASSVIMPGYTHLQQAQPVLLSHYWLSMVWALQRDRVRFLNAAKTADCMPLGSGALAGSGFAVDRAFLAKELGFSTVSENSMDGVASRDFALEALAAIASVGITMSRYAEDLIIWSSREFGFVELDDAWATGSSMMPQKKNPDSLELVRGKCGRFIGNYTRLAATLKGVGLTYYKDLQEDKEAFFDSAAQAGMALAVLAGAIRTLSVRTERIAAALDPFLFATDLADYLVRKGMPFRQAHKVVGRVVAHCLARGVRLDKMSADDLRAFSPEFGADAPAVFDWKTAVAHRDLPGGTGPQSLTAQIAAARALVG